MAVETATTPAIADARSIRRAPPQWLAPAIYAAAAIVEILAMLLMTVFRYRSQGLEPAYFELSKTGNILGAILAASFVVLFLVLSLTRRGRRAGLAAVALTLSASGLVILSSAPLVAVDDRTTVFAGYLVFKTLEWAYFMAVIGQRRRRTAWRIALRTITIALSMTVLGGIVLIGTLLLMPFSSDYADTTQRDFDAGVILGAAVWSGDRPSPVLRERIRTGFDLLNSGTVQFLVLTGSNAPGELSEAEVARNELLKLGADPTRIVLETTTRSTVQQVMFIRDQLLKQGWRSFVIISDQFHLTRALEICEFNGIDAQGVSSESPLGPQNLALYQVRESVALILYWMYGV